VARKLAVKHAQAVSRSSSRETAEPLQRQIIST
jgi:hypothetical protein